MTAYEWMGSNSLEGGDSNRNRLFSPHYLRTHEHWRSGIAVCVCGVAASPYHTDKGEFWSKVSGLRMLRNEEGMRKQTL